MKIAICLYGQARNYNYGYQCIKEMIEQNKEHTYDIYFHCWIDNNINYDCSYWRPNIEEKSLYIDNQNIVKDNIVNFYKPLSYLFEKPLEKNSGIFISEKENFKKSLMYINSTEKMQNNIYNTFSQICSRTRVRDIFEKYTSENNIFYDIVVTTRFDGLNFPEKLNFTEINKDKIYTCTMRLPNVIIPDNFLLMPQKIFLKWFNIYPILKSIINNKNLMLRFENFLVGANYIFGMEEILLCSYFLNCSFNLDNVEYVLQTNR